MLTTKGLMVYISFTKVLEIEICLKAFVSRSLSHLIKASVPFLKLPWKEGLNLLAGTCELRNFAHTVSVAVQETTTHHKLNYFILEGCVPLRAINEANRTRVGTFDRLEQRLLRWGLHGSPSGESS